MDSAKLIQVLVFAMAGVIVLIIIASGVHFARAVFNAQLAAEQQRRVLQLTLIAANAAREAQFPQLKQRSGVIVQQPDGSEGIAITMERSSTEASSHIDRQPERY